MGFATFTITGTPVDECNGFGCTPETLEQRVERIREELKEYDEERRELEDERAEAEKQLAEAVKALEDSKKDRGQVVAESMVGVHGCGFNVGKAYICDPRFGKGSAWMPIHYETTEYAKRYIANAVNYEIANAKADERERCARVVEEKAGCPVFSYRQLASQIRSFK